MAQTTDEIRREIEVRRGELAQNINELEHRVKNSVDLGLQFRLHTRVILGAAFCAGLLFGLFAGGRER